MTSAKLTDGGPAFAAIGVGPADNVYHQTGMTLRDWFAGQALAGIGTWTPGIDLDWNDFAIIQKRRAEWAYAQADAMLAARQAAQGEKP